MHTDGAAKDALIVPRPAVVADLEATSALEDLGRAEVAGQRGGRWLLQHDLPRTDAIQRHRTTLDDPDTALVVGTIDAVVVGYASALLSAAEHDVICMIDALIVHPRARTIGVGSAILGEVATWARASEAVALESLVLPGNRAGKNFFERAGMKTRKMRVSADL